MFKDEKCQGEQQLDRFEDGSEWRIMLLEAADRLEERGWCQGVQHDYAGRSCAIGALSAVIRPYGSPVEYGRAFVRLADAIGEDEVALKDQPTFKVIAAWNDDPARTVVEVVRKMRQVAWAPAQKPDAFRVIAAWNSENKPDKPLLGQFKHLVLPRGTQSEVVEALKETANA